jgi:ankyrin repeat protein
LNKELIDEMTELVWLTSIRSCDRDAVKRLIDESDGSSAPLRFANSTVALHWAAESGDVELLSLVLAHASVCGSVTDMDASGGTALHWAAGEGHLDACKLLVSKGAALDVCDAQGDTCLHLACYNGHEATARYLIDETGTRLLNCLNVSGLSPLHVAVMNRHHLLVHAFVDKGADPTLKAPGGQSALDIANESGDLDLIANFEPSSKRLLDRVIVLERREQSLTQELAAATEKSNRTAIQLRDLFRDLAALEARHQRSNELLIAAEALLERERTAAAERERALSEELEVAQAKVRDLTKEVADAKVGLGQFSSPLRESASATPLSARDIATLSVTLNQLNILLGLTSTAVGDAQAQMNAVTARIDRTSGGLILVDNDDREEHNPPAQQTMTTPATPAAGQISIDTVRRQSHEPMPE